MSSEDENQRFKRKEEGLLRLLRKRKPKESMTKKEGKGRELRRVSLVMHKLEVKKERKD